MEGRMSKGLRRKIAQMKIKELMNERWILTSQETAEEMARILGSSDLMNVEFTELNKSSVLVTYKKGRN